MSLAPTDDSLPPRWLRSAARAAAVVFLLVSIAVSVTQNLNNPWTSIRLAPSFALAQGYPLYSLPGEPPWVMMGYGPLFPVLYLPCVAAREPVAAVTVAMVLTHLYILVPVGLLCALFCARRRAERGRAPAIGVTAALIGFGVLVFTAGSLDYVTRRIHVDAPTFGLLLLMCYAVLRADLPTPQRAGLRWTLAAGLFGAMSVCCKLNALGSVGAVCLYVWWSAGWRRVLVLGLAAAVFGVAIYSWAVWQSGAAAIVHNFRTLTRFPWYTWSAMEYGQMALVNTSSSLPEKALSAAYLALQAIQVYGVAFLATALVAGALARGLLSPSGRGSTEVSPVASMAIDSAHRIIGCLLFVALADVPVAIASVAKYGGAINGWAFVALPLGVAGILSLVALLERAGRAGQLSVHASLVAVAGAVTLAAVGHLVLLHPERGTVLTEAFRAIKAHPGECYFASDPLAHLLAGERFRPSLDPVYSYAVAGAPVDAAAFRTVMPERLRYLAIARKMAAWGPEEVRRLLPEVSERTDQLGLRFHETWTKP